MQLTQYTDYSLRVLLYLGLNPDRRCTISEISEAFGVNRNHLVKVVHNLSSSGWITTIRGKTGGMVLAFSPEQINIGAVLRHTEPHFDLLECFNMEENTCVVSPACKLRHALYQARKAFLDVLDGYHLSDVLNNPDDLKMLLNTYPKPKDRETIEIKAAA